MLTAIVRPPASRLVDCELSFLERRPIDVARAREQHRQYRLALTAAGAKVLELPVLDELADSSFVEDTAIVLDEVAVVAPMGAESRRPETQPMASSLAAYRPVKWLEAPSTLDGGDVLRLGRTLYVGQTPRTNAAAVENLGRVLAPFNYRVVPVEVTRCLHLKSGVARLDDETVLVNPDWVDPSIFGGARALTVDASEQWGANAVRVGKTVIFPASEPRTRARVQERGYVTVAVDVSEFQKAEAGVTCLSLILEA